MWIGCGVVHQAPVIPSAPATSIRHQLLGRGLAHPGPFKLARSSAFSTVVYVAWHARRPQSCNLYHDGCNCCRVPVCVNSAAGCL